jgi:hypothetical protein
MSEDGKTMQERLETILREGRLLAQDAGHRMASFTRWAYRDIKRRLGWGHDSDEAPGSLGRSQASGAQGGAQAAGGAAKPKAGSGGDTTPEGYATGQVWQPKDSSKKARKIVDVEVEAGEYYLIWQPPEGGQRNRIKEASFTRWVRRENARP